MPRWPQLGTQATEVSGKSFFCFYEISADILFLKLVFCWQTLSIAIRRALFVPIIFYWKALLKKIYEIQSEVLSGDFCHPRVWLGTRLTQKEANGPYKFVCRIPHILVLSLAAFCVTPQARFAALNQWRQTPNQNPFRQVDFSVHQPNLRQKRSNYKTRCWQSGRHRYSYPKIPCQGRWPTPSAIASMAPFLPQRGH